MHARAPKPLLAKVRNHVDRAELDGEYPAAEARGGRDDPKHVVGVGQRGPRLMRAALQLNHHVHLLVGWAIAHGLDLADDVVDVEGGVLIIRSEPHDAHEVVHAPMTTCP